MKNIQESVLKAISGLLPEEVVTKVSNVIATTLDEATKEIESDYQAQLDEAYEQFGKEKQKLKEGYEQGYAQAFDLICEYKDRIELVKEELTNEKNSGFQEAWEMLQAARTENDDLAGELQREYDEKLADVEKFLVKKLDQFLPTQGKKYYEQARKDLLNDPVFAENKNAFERMLEAAAVVLTDDDYAVASGTKTESVLKENEELKKRVQRIEANNTRLKMDNDKLNETVRRTKTSLLSEQKEEQKVERKNRLERARKVEGRGEIEPRKDRQVVIREDNSGEPVADRRKDTESRLDEQARQVADYWNRMAGTDDRNEEE